VGGVRFTEPAADLAIAVAVAGSVLGFKVAREVAAVGELSLAGEVRPVAQAAQRRTEATRLGYRHVVDDGAKRLRSALEQIRAHAPRALDDVPAF